MVVVGSGFVYILVIRSDEISFYGCVNSSAVFPCWLLIACRMLHAFVVPCDLCGVDHNVMGIG